QKNTGEKISVSQLLKKVNNMKTILKKKSDINRTGNKKIILRGWEQKLLELLEGENSNPSIHSLSEKTNAGPQNIATVENSEETIAVEVAENDANLNHKTYTFVHEIPPKKIRKTIVDEYETSETHRLSMSELQRLVLLQQHKILNLKEQ
ncbi:unnamed protein product, partial [Tenebrio molitor]